MKLTTILAALSLTAAPLFAGTSSIAAGKGKGAAAPAPAAASSGITGSATLGYDSAYYFRGLWFSNNNLFGGLNFSVPMCEKSTFNFGALYTHSLDTEVGSDTLDYSELDLFASVVYDVGWGKIGVVATNYHFFDTFSGSVNGKTFGFDNVPDSTIDNAFELGLTATIPFGAANLYLGGYYDFKIDAPYFEIGADYTIKVTESLSLVPAVQVGYGLDYYTYQPVSGIDDGWTHVRAGISAPYKVSDTFTITPYVAANFALEARENLNTVEDQNDLFGGVSVSYSF
jgi:hypothetical protein